MTQRLTLSLDEDDARAVHEAIARYQQRSRWPEGGTLLPDGESDQAGAVLAEICRGWLEMYGAK
jgi:hypothetical protein